MINAEHTERDYSLLRPFDLEAAKRGEAICWHSNSDTLIYVGPAVGGKCCFKWTGGILYGLFETYPLNYVRMAPLAWAEGRPVYRGDVLYNKVGQELTATGEEGGKLIVSEFPDDFLLEPDFLHWTPPKVKREGWVNIYPRADFIPADAAFVSHAFSSKEKADRHAMSRRIDCIRIEWEEVAK